MRLPGFLKRLFAPLVGAIAARIQADDPWERLHVSVEPRAFGQGSIHEFKWYFEGESGVRADSIEAICEWLAGCEYLRDSELFHELDFWQHPATFETMRKGDCEDHAVWAWRKLVELGYHAELISGWWDMTREDAGGHAWVLFRMNDRDYILESVSKTPSAMVLPFDDVKACYCPHVAVDGQFKTVGFAGFTLSIDRRHKLRRGPRVPPTISSRGRMSPSPRD